MSLELEIAYLHGSVMAGRRYQRLRDAFDRAPHGSLLESYPVFREASIAARVAALRQYLEALPSGAQILEVGTAKGYFSHLLIQIAEANGRSYRVQTFDMDPRSAQAVAILEDELNQRDGRLVAIQQILGDSRTTVPQWCEQNPGVRIDFAWVDGGHDYSCASSDLRTVMQHGADLIGVDDTNMREVGEALRDQLQAFPQYRRQPHPYPLHDQPGIVFLRRVT